MRLSDFTPVLLALAVVPRLASAQASAESQKAMEEALALQKKSVALMETSVEAQRQAIQKQTPSGASFFLLPPPPPGPPIHPPPCDALPAPEVDSLVTQAAQREAVDPALLHSVMQQESGFHPCALSPKGAMGLMQLMPATASAFGVKDPFDPKENTSAGAKFLKELLDAYGGDISLALGAYNAGPGRVNEAGGVPPIPETIDYVKRILQLMPGAASGEKKQ